MTGRQTDLDRLAGIGGAKLAQLAGAMLRQERSSPVLWDLPRNRTFRAATDEAKRAAVELLAPKDGQIRLRDGEGQEFLLRELLRTPPPPWWSFWRAPGRILGNLLDARVLILPWLLGDPELTSRGERELCGLKRFNEEIRWRNDRDEKYLQRLQRMTRRHSKRRRNVDGERR